MAWGFIKINMNAKGSDKVLIDGEKIVHPRVARVLRMLSDPITPATHTRDQFQPNHGEILRINMSWDQVVTEY